MSSLILGCTVSLREKGPYQNDGDYHSKFQSRYNGWIFFFLIHNEATVDGQLLKCQENVKNIN